MDQRVSGAMVIARNADAAVWLSACFSDKALKVKAGQGRAEHSSSAGAGVPGQCRRRPESHRHKGTEQMAERRLPLLLLKKGGRCWWCRWCYLTGRPFSHGPCVPAVCHLVVFTEPSLQAVASDEEGGGKAAAPGGLPEGLSVKRVYWAFVAGQLQARLSGRIRWVRVSRSGEEGGGVGWVGCSKVRKEGGLACADRACMWPLPTRHTPPTHCEASLLRCAGCLHCCQPPGVPHRGTPLLRRLHHTPHPPRAPRHPVVVDGKFYPAVTNFRVKASGGGVSWVELIPETGVV